MDHEKAIKKIYCELSKTHDLLGIFLSGDPGALVTLAGEMRIKAVIVPSFEDLIHKQPVKETISYGKVLCELEDIRLMIKAFKEQDWDSVGILFTSCCYVNPRYRVFHESLEGRKERVAHMNEVQTLDRMYRMLADAKKRLPDENDNTMDTAAVGYHKESFLTAWKMARMIERYASGAPFEDVIDDSFLHKLAISDIGVVKAFSLVNELDKRSRETIDRYVVSGAKAPDVETAAWLDRWMESVLKDKYRIGKLQV